MRQLTASTLAVIIHFLEQLTGRFEIAKAAERYEDTQVARESELSIGSNKLTSCVCRYARFASFHKAGARLEDSFEAMIGMKVKDNAERVSRALTVSLDFELYFNIKTKLWLAYF